MKPTTTPVLTSLSTWRRFVRRAWFVHAVLLSSLLFLPASARGYWGIHTWEGPDTYYDEGSMSDFPNPHVDEAVWWDDMGNYTPLSSFDSTTLWADGDNDGLSLYQEMAYGTDSGNPDTDADSILDGDEVFTTGTSPLTWDTNGDAVSDFDASHGFYYVIYPSTASNWTYRDWDGDGTDNYLDNAPYDSTDSSQIGGGTGNQDPDADGDGLHAAEEATLGTSDNNVDSDGDGLTDYEEAYLYGSSPTSYYSLSLRHGYGEQFGDSQMVNTADSDNDNLPNCIENFYIGDSTSLEATGDLDGNGLNNLDQYNLGVALNADLNHYDADLDGMSDIYEDFHQLNKNNPTDAVGDADSDHVFNFEECALHTNPRSTDTTSRGGEGDWLIFLEQTLYPAGNIPTDDIEDAEGNPSANNIPDWLDQLRRTWAYYAPVSGTDWDGDGLPNTWEHKYCLGHYPNGLDLRNPDATADRELVNGLIEGDGLDNLAEYQIGLNPLVADTNSNGISDYNDDSDGDGLSNAAEVFIHHTKAWLKDSDGDGVEDGQEVADGSDPNDATSNLTNILGLHITTPLEPSS